MVFFAVKNETSELHHVLFFTISERSHKSGASAAVVFKNVVDRFRVLAHLSSSFCASSALLRDRIYGVVLLRSSACAE